MIEFLVVLQFISGLLTLIVGGGMLFFIRNKTQQNVKDNRPAGFWVRAICFGTDLAIIDILCSFLAYRGSYVVGGYITVLITLSYFFFFWLYFSATPAQMIVRIKILSKDRGPLTLWQALVRLGMFVFLAVGWVTILFDKKEKKALHDIVALTYVVYADKEIKTEPGVIKKIRLMLLGMAVILLVGMIVNGFGEKLTKYNESNQLTFFDLNNDGLADGLTMDVNKDSKSDVFKYDLNNDRVVDFTTYDTDNDGVNESIDINNDGHIDGFDFDKDNILDIQVLEGQFFIWLWKILYSVWIAGFAVLLVFGIIKERK